jgi:hypothetical protein
VGINGERQERFIRHVQVVMNGDTNKKTIDLILFFLHNKDRE